MRDPGSLASWSRNREGDSTGETVADDKRLSTDAVARLRAVRGCKNVFVVRRRELTDLSSQTSLTTHRRIAPSRRLSIVPGLLQEHMCKW
jgi:hypothetical protein